TLRRHLSAHHAADYRQWCTKTGFTSQLPQDISARKVEAAKASMTQGSLDKHVQKVTPAEYIQPYTDELFKSAAIQWLVETDQPIGAFEHPSFINMINVASRAKSGVVIPSRWTTRRKIINIFHQYLRDLKTRLNVRSTARFSDEH
ncbi:uncharacterized protein C8Q71DRAFT_716625, partial [Rhodofomes roseus]